jgi:hypothetical protein
MRPPLALLALLALAAHAQQPKPLTGSVIGHVDYATTQLPARFAELRLVPKPTEADLAPIPQHPYKPGDPPHQDPPHLTLVTGASGMDGNFRLDGVPPGDYLATPAKPGYILPGLSMVTILPASDDQLKALATSLPTVHVVVGQTSVVNLTLHRGATLSGRILFADGSPAIQASVEYRPSEDLLRQHQLSRKTVTPFQGALLALLSSYSGPSATDDEGHFRIFGLHPGKYVLSTVIALDHQPARLAMTDGSDPNSSNRGQIGGIEVIPVFAPGTFRRSEAKVFQIRGDEQITAPDLIIDPKGLHTLRGKILAGDDPHPPGGLVELQDQAAKDNGRIAGVDDDGGFQFNDLPSGTYTLTTWANYRNEPGANNATVTRTYKGATLTVIIAEQDVVLDDILLTPLKPGEQIEFPPF